MIATRKDSCGSGEALVQSQTEITVSVNKNIAVRLDNKGNIMEGGTTEGTATTVEFPSTASYRDNGDLLLPSLISRTEYEMEILVTKGLITDGILLNTEPGDKLFSSEHAALHEFAHGIMNVIMNEMGGKFNDINFNKMNDQDKLDWAIRFTNTLLQSKNETLETGQNQHNRTDGEKPDKSKVEPLTE